MAFAPMPRTFFIALALISVLQSVEVRGHLTQPQPAPQMMPQPQVIPIPYPVPQYQQQPQVIPVPQYVQQPQYIPVPQYIQQPPMYYPSYSKPSYHPRPHFDCYRGIKLDELIADMERINP